MNHFKNEGMLSISSMGGDDYSPTMKPPRPLKTKPMITVDQVFSPGEDHHHHGLL